MALKDITLGQFFPGDTAIHRMDPRAKLLLTVLYIVALFLASGIITYVVLFALLCLGVAVSRIKPKALLRGLKPVLIILIVTAILNVFYTPGDPVVSFWVFTITWQGIRNAIFMIWRIMMLISCTFLLTYTTSPIMLTDGLEQLLDPLKKIHVPVHELAMMMSIALRFIPTLIEETDKISAFRRADELATAMECRCYHGGDGRTRLKELHYRASDVASILVALLFCVAIGVLGRYGL